MFKSLIRHAEVKVFSPDYLPSWGMRLDHTLLDKEPFFIICRIEITLIVISASILLANSTKVKSVNLRVSYRIIGFRLAIISGGWCNATSEIMKAGLLMLLFLSPYLDIYYNPIQFIHIRRDWWKFSSFSSSILIHWEGMGLSKQSFMKIVWQKMLVKYFNFITICWTFRNASE